MDPVQQRILDRAADARGRGRYTEATAIFEIELVGSLTQPEIAIEYASLLSAQGLERPRAEFLHRVLEDINHNKDAPNAPTRLLLLELMLPDAEFWAYGKLDAALQAIRKARTWLQVAKPSEATKIEIKGFLLYYVMVYTISRDSNLSTEEDIQLLPNSGSDVVDQTLSIVQSLRESPNLEWAVRMASHTIQFITDIGVHQASVNTILDLLDWKDDCFSPTLAAASLVALYNLAGKMRADEDGSAGTRNKCQDLLERHLERLSVRAGLTWREHYPIIKFKQEFHGVIQEKDTLGKVDKLKKLAEAAKARSDYNSVNSALRAAIDVALVLDKQRRSEETFQCLRDVQAEYLTFHISHSGQGYFEADALSALLTTLFVFWKAHEQTIDELEKFEQRHAAFDVPRSQERMYSQGLLAAKALEKVDVASRFTSRRNAAYKKYPKVGHDSCTGRSEISQEASSELSYIMLEIDGVYPDDYRRGLQAVEVCMRWAAEEVERDYMPGTTWTCLFGKFVATDLNADPLSIYSAQSRQVANALYKLRHDEWMQVFQDLKSWLLADEATVHWSARLYALRAIAGTRVYRARKEWIDNHAQDTPTLDVAVEMADLEGEVKFIEAFKQSPSQESSNHLLAEKAMNVFRTSTLASTSGAWKADKVNLDSVNQAINDCDALIKMYREQHNDLGRFTTWCSKGRLLVNNYFNGGSVDVTTVLEPFDEADCVFREVRRNHLTTRSAVTSEALTRSLASYSHKTLCSEALVLTRSIFNTALIRWGKARNSQNPGESEEDRVARLNRMREQGHIAYLKFLAWTQRSKARQLSDLLGIDARLPKSLTDAYKSSPSAAATVEEETVLLSAFTSTPFPENLKIQDKLQAHRAEMRKNPLLAPIMQIRDGDTVDVPKIYEMLQQLPDKVVLVDFVYMQSQKQLLAICYRKNKAFFPAKLPVNMEEIKEIWTAILKSSHPLSGEHGLAALEKLHPLLQPLFKSQPEHIVWKHPNDPPCIQPGDTIVFCPTGILHRIPLHAIKVNGEPLIATHPVAYCQSLTILHHAWQSVVHEDNEPPRKRVVVNPMGLNTDAVKDVATKLGAELFNDFNIQKQPVLASLEGCPVFHYHGHVKFRPRMEAALCLDETAFNTRDAGERLSASDLFDVNLARPALGIIVGCQSGVATVSSTDDLLGIPTALHHAGATVVISSLWKIDGDDGAEFSRLFYKGVLRESEEIDGTDKEGRLDNLVDLAKAVQTALRKLMKDSKERERSPYHWSALTLNGFWLFPFLRGHKQKWRLSRDCMSILTSVPDRV